MRVCLVTGGTIVAYALSVRKMLKPLYRLMRVKGLN